MPVVVVAIDYGRKFLYKVIVMTQEVDPKLLEILVCPLTHTKLRYDMEKQELISDRAKLAYPIRDGIPVMLIDEARDLDGVEVKK